MRLNLTYQNPITAYSLLVFLPLLLYIKSIWYPFSPLDEQWLIVGDEHYIRNWSYLLEAFGDSIQKTYYRPLLIASLVIDYHIGKLNPLIYHTTNLLLHITAVLLLYRFLLQLKAVQKTALLLSLMFSVHPVLVHAVAWIPGRNDSLLCIFVIASLIHLNRFLNGKGFSAVLWHLFFFTCALFTKENAVLLPLIFLFMFFLYKKINKNIFFFIVVWTAFIITWYQIRSAIIPQLHISFPADPGIIKNFLYSFTAFSGKSLLPLNQSVTPVPGTFLLMPGILAVIVFYLLYRFYCPLKKRTAQLGLLLFTVLLALPVWLGVISPLGEQFEHRIYTSMAGLMLFLSALEFKKHQVTFHTILVILIFSFGIRAFVRMNVYSDPEIYLKEAISAAPGNYFLHMQIAQVYASKKKYNASIHHFSKAIELNPGKSHLYVNRGNFYASIGRKKEAGADFNMALQLTGEQQIDSKNMKVSKYSDILNARLEIINRLLAAEPFKAILYVKRAKIYFEKRMGPEALSDLKKACELEPRNLEFRGFYNELLASYPK